MMPAFLIIFAERYLYILIILIAIAYVLAQKHVVQRYLGLLAGFSLPMAFLFGKIVDYFYYIPIRHGFLPDQTLICFAITAIIFAYNKKLGAVLGFLSFLVGLTLLNAGVAASYDILEGFVISSISVFIVRSFIRHKIFTV